MFKQKKLSLGARFGLIVASFFLGLLLFFTAIATALIGDVRIVMSKDGIAGINRPARRQRAFLDSEIEGIPTFCSFECFL